MSLGEQFKQAKAAGQPACNRCVFYRSLPANPAGQSGTCNLSPPQIVSHEGKLHYLFPAVAEDWYCGHFVSTD